jgi:uncharacterized small protein (DUF1192 family)
MTKLKPDFWGNIIYETAMGLYDDEDEAKEESWMQENFFPLYSEDSVKSLENEISKLRVEISDLKKQLENK